MMVEAQYTESAARLTISPDLQTDRMFPGYKGLTTFKHESNINPGESTPGASGQELIENTCRLELGTF